MERVQVRLASDDPLWVEDRTRQLAPVEDIVVTGSIRLGGLTVAAPPAVVLVDAGTALDPILDTVGRLTRTDQGSAYVLMLRAGMDAPSVYPRAALAGVRVVLPGHCELPELAEGIYRTADCVTPPKPGQEADTGPGGSDRLVVVFGTKGGVGKTTLAVNLAVAFAKRGLRTALLDLHFDWGQIAIHLRGTPPRPFGELLAETKRLDADLLQSFMVRHATGVHVLQAPPKPEMAEFINQEHVAAFVTRARDGFDRVVIDTPAGFPETVFPALEHADHLLLVTTPDVPALRNARAALGVLDLLQLGRAKTHLILNRATASHGVRRADVEVTLGQPIWASLPADDAVVTRAANEGLPVADVSPGSRYGRAVTLLARQLAPSEARPHQGRRPEGRAQLHPAGAATR